MNSPQKLDFMHLEYIVSLRSIVTNLTSPDSALQAPLLAHQAAMDALCRRQSRLKTPLCRKLRLSPLFQSGAVPSFPMSFLYASAAMAGSGASSTVCGLTQGL